MSEAPNETPSTEDDSSGQGQPPTPEQIKPAEDEAGLRDAGKQALDRMKAERNDAAKRVKALESELEKFRQASMTEQEKQVTEAENRGRLAAAGEFGKRLARTEFDALAGRRNADYDTAPALELIDLAKFVGDDGEPDAKAIRAAVERIVPEPQTGPPSYDGGPRASTPPAVDMNKRMREALGR